MSGENPSPDTLSLNERVGRFLRDEYFYIAPYQRFHSALRDQLHPILSPAAHLPFDLVLCECRNAIQHFRLHGFASGRYRLARARNALAQLPEPAKTIGESMILAADAYDEYKLGNYSTAHNLITNAWRNDLDNVGAFPELTTHLVQLAHNQARILLRSGESQRGATLYLRILDYLEVDQEPNPLQIPSAALLRRGMRRAQSRMIAHDFLHFPGATEVVTGIQEKWIGCQVHALVNYLQKKDLESAAELIDAGPRPSDVVWRLGVKAVWSHLTPAIRSEAQRLLDTVSSIDY